MKIGSGEFTICIYRDFYDVPRLMLAIDGNSNRWIFECIFDDEIEEYVDFYRVYPVTPEVPDAEAIPRHLKSDQNRGEATIPVSAMHFDESNRRSFVLEA